MWKSIVAGLAIVPLVVNCLLLLPAYADVMYPCGAVGKVDQLCGPNANAAGGSCKQIGEDCVNQEPGCSSTSDYYCVDDDQCLEASYDPSSYCGTSNYTTQTPRWRFTCPSEPILGDGSACECVRETDFEDTASVTYKALKAETDMCDLTAMP